MCIVKLIRKIFYVQLWVPSAVGYFAILPPIGSGVKFGLAVRSVVRVSRWRLWCLPVWCSGVCSLLGVGFFLPCGLVKWDCGLGVVCQAWFVMVGVWAGCSWAGFILRSVPAFGVFCVCLGWSLGVVNGLDWFYGVCGALCGAVVSWGYGMSSGAEFVRCRANLSGVVLGYLLKLADK